MNWRYLSRYISILTLIIFIFSNTGYSLPNNITTLRKPLDFNGKDVNYRYHKRLEKTKEPVGRISIDEISKDLHQQDNNDRKILPLKLQQGKVERVAEYEADVKFWDLVENKNRGTFERVKKVLATYFDSTEHPLKKGVDYDAIVGRGVRIHLKHPVTINDIEMYELNLKGAPFTKLEQIWKVAP